MSARRQPADAIAATAADGAPAGLKVSLLLSADQVDAIAQRVADLIAPDLWKRMEAPAAQPADGWLNTRDAAAYLGTTTNALHKLTANRKIPFEQDGPGCWCWFRRADLDAWRENGGARRRPP